MCALILLGAGMRHAWGARSGSKRQSWKAVQSCSLTRSRDRSLPWVYQQPTQRAWRSSCYAPLLVMNKAIMKSRAGRCSHRVGCGVWSSEQGGKSDLPVKLSVMARVQDRQRWPHAHSHVLL